ncbi:MAG TPA: Clp protease N-terminal domain-containing protein [Solirubrobacteraceae bacterium]|jgi:ATP-dependent Clp protease ATP-binding subunit ClpA|nr:Clp protease N-terminal domain-containing protein [Solirubrobacteraceae bacterium]
MPFERLAGDARAIVHTAVEDEARASGHGSVEAEHLLLALAAHPALLGLGLDRDELVAALAQEEERSLAAVGIAAADFDLPAGHRGPRKPRLAASIKLAIARAVAIAAKRGDRRITAKHLLYGVLDAEQGRVPRALRIAGIDRAELRARI